MKIDAANAGSDAPASQQHVVIFRLRKLARVEFLYFVEVLWTDYVTFVDGGVGEVLGGDGADYFPVV